MAREVRGPHTESKIFAGITGVSMRFFTRVRTFARGYRWVPSHESQVGTAECQCREVRNSPRKAPASCNSLVLIPSAAFKLEDHLFKLINTPFLPQAAVKTFFNPLIAFYL